MMPRHALRCVDTGRYYACERGVMRRVDSERAPAEVPAGQPAPQPDSVHRAADDRLTKSVCIGCIEPVPPDYSVQVTAAAWQRVAGAEGLAEVEEPEKVDQSLLRCNATQLARLFGCFVAPRLVFSSEEQARNLPFRTPLGYGGGDADGETGETKGDPDKRELAEEEGEGEEEEGNSVAPDILPARALGIALDQMDQPQVPNVYVDLAFDDEGQSCGVGLFANEDLAEGTYVGEYTGVLIQGGVNPYSCHYPSYQGDLQVSALSCGNHIRCINHGTPPNAMFRPVLHRGIPRIATLLVDNVKEGGQILVDYGHGYWAAHESPAKALRARNQGSAPGQSAVSDQVDGSEAETPQDGS